MRKQQTSLTAAGIAVARAIESEKPEGERICNDPFARRLAPGWLYTLTAVYDKLGLTERRGPGVMGYLAARERYIDDVLQGFLGRGMQQLVILGAGYDARAYRFHELSRVRVFEVDHPATQADKRARMQALLGSLPTNVSYVSVDFNTQALGERLAESGYDPGLKTLFIWQGVTMYLTLAAVEDTLRYVAQYSGPGSAVAFDYLYRSTLDGVGKHAEVSGMRRYRFMTGEALTFGIAEGTVEAFLKERGYRQVHEMNAESLKRAYFTGKNAGRKVASGYGIVVAEI